MKKLTIITLLFAIFFGFLNSCDSSDVAEQDELYEINKISNPQESATDKPKIKRPGNGS